MPRDFTKKEVAAEDLKIAQHMVDSSKMEATDTWVDAGVAEQHRIIEKAEQQIEAVIAKQVKAKQDLPLLERRLAEKRANYAELVNKTDVDKTSSLMEQIAKLIQQARDKGEDVDALVAQLKGQ